MLFPFCYSGGLVEILADQLFRSASQAAASINCIAGTVMVSNIFRGGITDFSCLFIGGAKLFAFRKEVEIGKGPKNSRVGLLGEIEVLFSAPGE